MQNTRTTAPSSPPCRADRSAGAPGMGPLARCRSVVARRRPRCRRTCGPGSGLAASPSPPQPSWRSTAPPERILRFYNSNDVCNLRSFPCSSSPPFILSSYFLLSPHLQPSFPFSFVYSFLSSSLSRPPLFFPLFLLLSSHRSDLWVLANLRPVLPPRPLAGFGQRAFLGTRAPSALVSGVELQETFAAAADQMLALE